MFCSECGAHLRERARFCGKCGVRQGDLQVGALLDGRYRVDALIGSGAMGAVYRAWDLRLRAPRAVKEMSTADTTAAERDETRARFFREAQLLSHLQHPGLPRVQDCFSAAGRHYLVMDLVEGENLDARLQRHGCPGLTESQVVNIATQILDILAFLHGQPSPIVYRDLKPSNAMITPAGNVVLVDFGIARVLSAASGVSAVGTHGYCPPEQYAGYCDPRSDIYALGATMHHLLSGRPSPVPFHFMPLRTVVPHLSPPLAEVVHQALALQPDERFASAHAMKIAIEAISANANRIPANAGQVAPTVTNLARPAKTSAPARLNPVDGSLLVRLAGGTVVMPSTSREGQETHEVTLDAFWIAPRPVTNAQFRRFVNATGYQPAPHWTPHVRNASASAGAWERYAVLWGEDAPVVGVSRRDAEAYCRWASLRLPCEAEWALTTSTVPQAGLPQASMGDQATAPALMWHVPEWCSPSPSLVPVAPSAPRLSAVRGGVWAAPDALPGRLPARERSHTVHSVCAGFRCAANA